MSVKINAGSTWVSIANRVFPKNTLSFEDDENSGKVTIERIATGRVVCTDHFSEYKDSTNVPYTSLSALMADLKSKLFV